MSRKFTFHSLLKTAKLTQFSQKTTTENSIQDQWDQVDDFKWLKAEPSPNWSVLPEVQRLKEETWTNVVQGGPGIGLEDVFKKIGLAKVV